MTIRPRDRVAIAVALAAVLVAGVYMFVLKPQRDEASSLAGQIAAQQQTLSQTQAKYAAGRAAQASLRSDSHQWAAARRAVPHSSNVPGLLRILQHEAKVAHVSVQSIDFAGASGSTSTSSATPSRADGATTIPVSLTFAGGYQALNRLVHRLDTLVAVSGKHVHASGPLIGISNVSLSSSSSGSTSGLTVQLTATIYQLAGSSTVLGPTEGTS